MQIIPRISFIFIATSMLSTFVLSSSVLALFGYNFALEGGSFLFKLHPSFYLLFLGYLSIFLYQDGANLVSEALLKRRNFFLLIACVFCFCYQVVFLKQSMAPFIVTWLSPVLIFCLIDKFSVHQKRVIYISLLIIVSFNALMGVAEYIHGDYFIPKRYFSMETGELLDISEWGFERAGALYGHPLAATLVSALVVVGLYAKSSMSALSSVEKICFWSSLLSLPAFGGRTSIAVGLLIISCIGASKFYRALQGMHIPPLRMILFLIGLLSLPFALLIMFDFGLFDSVIARLQDDNGSAESRLTAFYILFDTSFLEILFGDFNKQLFYRQLLYGTKYGIEIFWLAILLQFGALVSAAMTYILFVIHRYLYEYSGKYSLWISLTFLMCVSSGTGLASKTLMLSHFVILSLFLFSPVTDEREKCRKEIAL